MEGFKFRNAKFYGHSKIVIRQPEKWKINIIDGIVITDLKRRIKKKSHCHRQNIIANDYTKHNNKTYDDTET